MRSLRTALLVGPTILILASAAAGQVPEDRSGAYTPHPEAEEAIARLKSPFCPGLMLEVCPSPQAAVLRDSIQMLAQEGMDADSLVEWMLANHGEEWRAMPRAQGKGFWAWIMPPGALILGLVVLALALRTFRDRARSRGDEPAREISPDEESRLEEALRELEEAESEDALL